MLSEIANTINSNIQVTVDSPELNPDGKMPVLDLKIWISEYEGIPQISHTFYRKPVSSPYTILKRSAVSESVKRSTIFQEGLRRLLHISSDQPWAESVKHLNEYSNCLRLSGYSEAERYQTIRGEMQEFCNLGSGRVKAKNFYNPIISQFSPIFQEF